MTEAALVRHSRCHLSYWCTVCGCVCCMYLCMPRFRYQISISIFLVLFKFQYILLSQDTKICCWKREYRVCVCVFASVLIVPIWSVVVSSDSLSSLQLHLSQAAMETHKGTRCFKVNPFKWLSLCYLVKSMCLVTTSSNGNLTRQETFTHLCDLEVLWRLRNAITSCCSLPLMTFVSF